MLDMQEDMKTPLILRRPFLSTTNAHIDVGARETKFNINRKEERFPFKPRLKQCSILECHEEQKSRSLSPGPENTPKNNSTGEVQFGGLKIPEPFAGGNSVVIYNLIFHISFTYLLFQ
jgi:hypothetical protein